MARRVVWGVSLAVAMLLAAGCGEGRFRLTPFRPARSDPNYAVFEFLNPVRGSEAVLIRDFHMVVIDVHDEQARRGSLLHAGGRQTEQGWFFTGAFMPPSEESRTVDATLRLWVRYIQNGVRNEAFYQLDMRFVRDRDELWIPDPQQPIQVRELSGPTGAIRDANAELRSRAHESPPVEEE